MGGGLMIAVRGRIEAIEADITTLSVEAIVNPANCALLPGGGVDGAIRRKAGREIDEALYHIGGCAEGEAVLTSGYRLPAKFVIHTVAPIWAGGAMGAGQEQTLARCYQSPLTIARKNNIRTIAFPAIGTGAYGWPPDTAAKIAFDAVVAHLGQCEIQVTFCCFTGADKARYADLIATLSD
jgi:O-acetyl-ADP-ribose deacetylase (regulator of RNase III)